MGEAWRRSITRFSKNDPPRRSIGQIVALSWYLGYRPKQVGGTGADHLHLRCCLPCQCLRDIIWVSGKWPEPRMDFEQIVEASCHTAQLAGPVSCKANRELRSRPVPERVRSALWLSYPSIILVRCRKGLLDRVSPYLLSPYLLRQYRTG